MELHFIFILTGKEQGLKPFVQIKDHVLFPKAGEIERVDEEFRQITIMQTSKVHPGFCEDPQETLQKLFDQLVL